MSVRESVEVSSPSDFWKQLWNEKAKHESVFVQIGRSSYTPLHFFLMVKNICDSLHLNKDDIVLDAGGGVGWVSMYVSPFVKEVVLFDYAEEMVSRARELASYFNNICVEQDDLLTMNKVRNKYTKVIISSVLQYLENHDQVKTVLSNIHDVMVSGALAIFTHNPDLRKKEAHIKSYDRLDWDKERIKHGLEMEDKRLWLDINQVERIACEVGFSMCYEVPINPKLWQSTHMFDFVTEK
jgi:SAM-dependent methyltransferase